MRVKLSPISLISGERLTVTLADLPSELAGETVEVELASVDEIETAWAASMSAVVSDDRTWSRHIKPTRQGETVFTLAKVAVKGTEGEELRDLTSDLAGSVVFNATRTVRTTDDVRNICDALLEKQWRRYEAGLGNLDSPGALEHRVLCVVERLLMTTRLRLPGVEVIPITATRRGADEAVRIQQLIDELGWTTRMKEGWWEATSDRARPWTAVMIKPIWAPALEGAARLAWEERDRLLDIFSVTRGLPADQSQRSSSSETRTSVGEHGNMSLRDH